MQPLANNLQQYAVADEQFSKTNPMFTLYYYLSLKKQLAKKTKQIHHKSTAKQ